MNLHAFDAMILRAMLRLARRRQEADDGEIAVRVCQPPSAVRGGLRRLDALGLVERREASTRLTMQGFALAVALLPHSAHAAKAARRTPRAA